MRTIHLHIGSPKTGTTSIQNNFFVNKSKLRNQGFLYPGKTVDQQLIYFGGKPEKEFWPRKFKSINARQLDYSVRTFFQNFETEINKDGNKHLDVIASSEYLFEYKEGYVQCLTKYLKRFFDEIKVYVFLRIPIHYYKSAEQQGIKHRSYIINPWCFKYPFRDTITRWSNHTNLRVLKYSPGLDSFDTLSESLGLESSEFRVYKKKLNPSMSIEQMLLLEKLQHHLYQNYENRFKNHLSIISQINSSFTNKPELQEWVRPVIHMRHKEDLFWLSQNHGIDFGSNSEDQTKDMKRLLHTDKVTVRSVFKVDNEHMAEKYEALILDSLLKKIVKTSSVGVG